MKAPLHITDFSTEYNNPKLPFWVYTYVPNGSLYDSLYFFHDSKDDMEILTLEEPYLFNALHISIEEFDHKFRNTKATQYTSFYGGPEASHEYLSKVAKYNNKNTTLEFFPLFFLYSTFQSNKSINFRKQQQYISDIKKHFTVPVNQPRLHRLVMLDMLTKYNTLHSCIYSYHSQTNPSKLKYTVNYNLDYQINDFDFKINKPDSNDNPNDPSSAYELSSIHTHSSLTVATETVYESVYYTEKTFVPLMLGKPVIIHGGVNCNKVLTNFGFKLFDDTIDYSFDTIQDVVERTEALAIEMKRLSTLYTADELYTRLLPVAEHNKNVAKDILFENKFIPDSILRLIDKYGSSNIWQSSIFNWYLRTQKKIKRYE